MSHCPICCTRFDACGECHTQEIAKRDAEIEALKAKIERMSKCFYFWEKYRRQDEQLKTSMG